MDQLVEETGTAIREILMRHMPSEPALSKWTKLMPCAKFCWQTGVHGLLHELIKIAGRGFDYPQGAGPVGIGDASADPDVELTWHQLAGSRLRRTLVLTSSFESRFHMHLICVAVQPCRLLHQHFLKLANRT
eukprot:2106010-Pyramimonas_sp.AAC.1